MNLRTPSLFDASLFHNSGGWLVPPRTGEDNVKAGKISVVAQFENCQSYRGTPPDHQARQD
jgi:hypothetical protein